MSTAHSAACRRTLAMVAPPQWEHGMFHHRRGLGRGTDGVYRTDTTFWSGLDNRDTPGRVEPRWNLDAFFLTRSLPPLRRLRIHVRRSIDDTPWQVWSSLHFLRCSRGRAG